MNMFWDKIILPIAKKINAKHIVEIGCLKGKGTHNILDYCQQNKARLSAIDPKPQFDIDDMKSYYSDTFDFYKDISLNALSLIKDYDLVLIDGDHNWYTVYNELKLIEESNKNKNFPIIFLHDVAWPYARRDCYYNPDAIPQEFRHPYKKAGLKSGEKNLVKEGGICSHLCNAIYEGNIRNGVLTAVEDFLNETKQKLSFQKIEKWYGLGIIYTSNDHSNDFIKELFTKYVII